MNKKLKYRIYIDEVGNNDLKSSIDQNHRYLSLTGLIFELDYIKDCANPKFEKFKKKYFNHHPDEPIILHRKKIFRKKYPFNILKDIEVEKSFNSDLFELLNNLEYTVVSVLIDKLEYNKKYKVWKYDPYHYCLEIIIERFFFFLENNDCIGDIFVEARGGKEDYRLKKAYQEIYQSGTHFVEYKKLQKRLTSKELKIKAKSLNITGLQLADIIALPSKKFILREYNKDEVKSYQFEDKIIEIIKNKYYKSESGIIGYGIKLLP